MPELQRSKEVVRIIKEHVDQLMRSGSDISAVSAFLSQFASVVFYAEMEEQVASILRGRMRIDSDTKLGHFLFMTNEKILNRIKKSDIAETAKLFGEDAHNALNAAIDEQQVSFYSNVIVGRHQVAHAAGWTLTIQDIEKAITAGDYLLDRLEHCIK